MNKSTLLIVGAFSIKNKSIYGGILKSCNLILESKMADNFEIIKLNSAQISHPTPGILLRSFKAFIRIFKFLIKMIYYKPNFVLIFSSDGASAIEKGFMVLICYFTRTKSFIFPRAGNLISQVQKSLLMNFLIKFLFSKATVFLCQSNVWKNFAIEKIGFDESRTSIINNWTATDKLLKIGANKKFNSGYLKILFVGWIEESKGVKEILIAFKRLSEEYSNLNLTFVGNGSYFYDAKAYVQKNYLNSSVNFVGWVDGVKLEKYYQDNDVFVLPSKAEGMPNALIEAMAAGLAVITSTVGSIPDFITNEENGMLIDQNNSEALYSAINKVIKDRHLKKYISQNGYEVAKKKFSSKVSLEKLSDIIENTT
tara:strand:+ start:43061 stop:44164 length:1104 start_codon:yes stop_codon:yes gene_type:complete